MRRETARREEPQRKRQTGRDSSISVTSVDLVDGKVFPIAGEVMSKDDWLSGYLS